MEDKKINWHEQIGIWIILVLSVSVIIYLTYDYHNNYKEVCVLHKTKILTKAHETESINSLGATRNNYYVYLEDLTIEEVTLDTYSFLQEGAPYQYTECYLEPIK
jgi:hypothetical protein